MSVISAVPLGTNIEGRTKKSLLRRAGISFRAYCVTAMSYASSGVAFFVRFFGALAGSTLWVSAVSLSLPKGR